MRNRRQLLSDGEGTREIWPAFTDVMSTLALILFVLVLLAYVRSVISAKRVQAFQTQIAASVRRLDELNVEIARGRAALGASEAQRRQQDAVLADNNRQLDELRGQLQQIAVLRVDVLTKLKQAIEAELGPRTAGGAELVTIADNGNIVINEKLVFEYASYAIKSEAKPLLASLAKALGNVLDDANVRANIDTIVIQGHTDERGSAAVNWDLSAKRSTAVLGYLFESNKALADTYGSYFAAAAYSKYRPINPGKSEDAYQQNRRMEISIIPKDENVRKVLDAYTQSAPAPPAPP